MGPWLDATAERGEGFAPWLTKKRRNALAGAGLALWLLSLSGIFGNSGLWQAYKLRLARQTLSLRVESLSAERARLQSLRRLLERDRGAQEVVIRDTLGFVRDGEVVFEFVD